ncbi:catabolite control protein A [Clostridium puniceum]|uniref:Catabolite control protein A n=1 Tax=Clostridium puniceum TaxID=29367 RepID=A0A1S8SXD4_9CLOT|nr:LacI family DNA-binding transcriptional regulator [Clostridium puniceum]OOM70167.1 catabolite control protein A [Clostridium puniceum]
MANIKEIAKESGVSIATVSNIINGKPGAGEETRKRVLETIKKLDYRPNVIAKNLKQKNNRTIGIITEDLTVFNTPDIVDGINEYCDEHNYEFVLGNLRLYKKYDEKFYHSDKYYGRVVDEFKMMESKQVEGIIYVGCHSRNLECIPSNFSIPIVIAYGFDNDKEFSSVIFNDEQGAYEATCKLIEAGHQNIGVIYGAQQSIHAQQRLIGYQRALYDNKILFNPQFIQQGDWSRKSGYEASEIFFEQNVTAIFAMNDLMAGGVYDFFYEKEHKIGTDIAIVGFDNREVSKAYNPSLSTIELPLFEIGRQSAKLLIDMITQPHKEVNPEIYKIDCKFIERKSIYKNIIDKV